MRKALITSVLVASLAATSATAGDARAPAGGGGSNDGEIIGGVLLLGLIGWLIYNGSNGGGTNSDGTVSTRGGTDDAGASGRDRGKVLMKF